MCRFFSYLRFHVVCCGLRKFEEFAVAGAGLDVHLHNAAEAVLGAGLGADLGHVPGVVARLTGTRRKLNSLHTLNSSQLCFSHWMKWLLI